MGHPAVHFELNGPDPEAAATFYAALFGWQTQAVPGDYITVDTASGAGINGGLGKTDKPPYATFYVETDDLQTTLDRAETLGGKVVTPITEMQMVTFAHLSDPAGNTIGLVAPGEGPGVSAGSNPSVEWFEVLGPDPKSLWGFYADLLGWEAHDVSQESFAYAEMHTGTDRGIQGGIGSSPDGQGHVNIYAKVDEVQRYCDRAGELGGGVVMPPTDMGNLQFAIIHDPQGTSFGLYRRAE